jgi:HAD superfamily hydrolase (TIGR01509 family)
MVDALIFDLDGVIVDNNDSHAEAWRVFLERYDITISEDEFKDRFFGKHNDEIINALFPDVEGDDAVALYEEKEAIYRDLYEPTSLPGLNELLERADEYLAVATNAPAQNMHYVLDALDLKHYFDVIKLGADVDRAKPYPDIYEAVAHELDVDPPKCIVFEDSPTGVEAAKRAGMTVVGVLTTFTRDELEADTYIHDFTAFES